MKKLCPRKDAPSSGVPTQVGTSDCRKFRRVSGLPGNLKKSAQVSRVISTSGVSTQVGTSNCWKFRRVSGLPRSLKKSARVSGVIPTSEVLTKVGSSDCREFQLESGLPTQVGTSDWTSDIPDRKSCSDLAFWIPIRTVPNSWET